MLSQSLNKIPELLAPAGTMEALRVVLEAGADSVYIAGKLFGMRQHAPWLNFSNEQLSEAIQITHDRGKKIYIAVNNLLTTQEVILVQRFLDFLEVERPDAVILQDLGLLHLCRQQGFPIPLHVSTMMNVHDIETAQFLGDLGISRIIPSRDIPLCLAVGIQEATGIECEVFLHGDMCIAHSGQCLTSGILAGESSNRGKCLKPCRWQFDLLDLSDATTPLRNPHDGDYLLARKDLSLLEQLADVAGSGIASLKIEGRARKPDYLQYIVSTYRHALDQYAENPDAFSPDESNLEEWTERRIRNQSTCYTFGNPQADSIDYSGKREPRIFSIAIEQQEHRPESVGQISSGPLFSSQPILSVHCSSLDAAVAAVESGADCVRLTSDCLMAIDLQSDNGVLLQELAKRSDLGIVLDRVLTPKDWNALPTLYERCCSLGIGHLVTSHLGMAQWARQSGLRLVSDYGLNVLNSEALDFLLDQDFDQVTLSLEASLKQIAEIATSQPGRSECVVHGPLTGMLMEHCVINASLGEGRRTGTCHDLCATRSYALRDQTGQIHQVVTDRQCRNHLLLPLDLCSLAIIPQLCALGIGSLRIEGRYYNPDLVSVVVDCYRRAITTAFQGESFYLETDETYRKLITLSQRGFSLSSFGKQSQDVSLPGESVPDEVLITHNDIQNIPPVTFELLVDEIFTPKD